MYFDGHSLRDISLRLGCSKNKVRSSLMQLGLELKDFWAQDDGGTLLKPRKTSAQPYYGFCYYEGQIVKDPNEFLTLLIIHDYWSKGRTPYEVTLELNRAKVPSRKRKKWSWAMVRNVMARFESKKVILLPGGGYELR